MKAINLKTEHLTDPVGIDISKPYLSWTCEDGITQTAYEIEATEDGNLLWSSGRVSGSQMHAILEQELRSRQRVSWRVRLWDEAGRAGTWSKPAVFETGIMDKTLFKAAWINPELVCDPETHKPASYLRRSFHAEKGKAARLYITCHGLYEAYINGKRVGEFVLAPGCYNYDRKVAYQTYDVTELVKDGENLAEVILGDGWYRSVSGVDGDRNLYGTGVALYFQLEIDKKVVCVSDESWTASQSGPIRENDMQQGEVVDARMEEITDYHEVRGEDFGVETLACSNCMPIVEMEHFTGTCIRTPNGETVIDYGQNMAGYIMFRLKAHAGQKIVLTHGETLDENGNFTQENFQDRKRHKEGGTRQQVVYTCKEGWNEYKAKFTIWGFRYAKAETDIDLRDAEFTAIAVYSRMQETGTFTCSNADVNRLVHNSIWSQKSNFCDVPTDCPTRERAAWTGDMGVFASTGLYLADCYPVIRKWLAECRLTQYEDGKVSNISPRNNKPGFFSELLAGSVGWGDACIIVPYVLYERYGDVRILEENYGMMQKWYAFLEERAKNKPENAAEHRQQNPYRDYTIETGVDYGEWCEPDVESTSAMRTPQEKVATAYYARSGQMLARIAQILGKTEDAGHYREVAENAGKAFRYIAVEDGRLHSERQAEYVRAITFELLTEDERRQAADDLNRLVRDNDYHLNTGFLSTPQLCAVLADNGYVESAYRLLLQDTMPGWLYQVKKGATTIWETWDGINEEGVPSASLNHYSKGAVTGWLFEGVCGIRLMNGSEIEIKPQPCRMLDYAKAVYHSPVGDIESGWRCEGEKFVYEIVVTANTSASILLPDGRKERVAAGRHCF
ncbi:MAG: glycoside hydrolase family 78 protein [Lachnospiraceae bacterium]|nr:glycoside hydrolase family 78 protein [Lachnospiraceae bacterium]